MNHAVLLLIDVQQGFDDPKWGIRNNPDAEANMELLLKHWRAQGWPIIHIQHHSTEADSPLRPDQAGNAFEEFAEPIEGEAIFTKTVNSAFIGNDLEQYLRQHNFIDLVIVGLTTDHCVSTSTRMAGNLGFNVQLVGDACATFNRKDLDGNEINAEEIHRIHLSSLHGEFCSVVSTKDLC